MKLRSILKKGSAVLLAAALLLSVACSAKEETPAQGDTETKTEQSSDQGSDESTAETVKLKIGASPAPHAEILEALKEEFKAAGIEIEIVQFTDYIQPNLGLHDGDLDANYFQHEPYLLDFNEENSTDLITAAYVHYEPMGLFPSKTSSVDALQDGATIAVPNDATNEARALQLLQDAGILELKEGVGLAATIADITQNPKNIKFYEIEAAQVARILPDVDMAVINGNYAIDAGLQISDAIAKESAESEAAQTFANVIAVRSGDENRDEIKKLVEVLKSEASRKFIEDTYKGSVLPVF